MQAMRIVLLLLALSFEVRAACPAPGDQAPRFSLPLAQGGRVSLTDLLARKKPLLVSFWRFDCEPCTRELPELERLSAKWGEAVGIVMVHVGGPQEKMLAFLGERHLGLPAAIDEFEKTSERYCAQQLPQLVLVDAAGVVRNRWAGEQPSLAAALERALAALSKVARR